MTAHRLTTAGGVWRGGLTQSLRVAAFSGLMKALAQNCPFCCVTALIRRGRIGGTTERVFHGFSE